MRRVVIEEACPECGRYDPHPFEHGWYGPLRREIDHDDFHRLLSHVTWGGHICSPRCARLALIGDPTTDPDNGWRHDVAMLGGDPTL